MHGSLEFRTSCGQAAHPALETKDADAKIYRQDSFISFGVLGSFMKRPLTLKEVGRVRRALVPLRNQFPSQSLLASALGVSQQTVSAVLSGAQFPGMRFAQGVAQARGMTLETLLTTPSAAPQEQPPSEDRNENENK